MLIPFAAFFKSLAQADREELQRLPPKWGRGDLVGGILLAGMLSGLLGVSWRRWCDPIVDFGRELYTAWRLSVGDVLYRDVEGIYGPASQYFNATLFKLFGPGMMVLAFANLALLIGIVGLLYVLLRRAWGRLAAVTALFVFLGIFAVAQLAKVGNYNFITPYSHEAVHGFAVCVALVALLPRWISGAGRRNAFFVGTLLGLTCVLKPEFMLAGGLLFAAAEVLRRRIGTMCGRAQWASWAAGLVTPSAAFFVLFMRSMDAKGAFSASGRAWLNVLSRDHVDAHVQAAFAGFDQPWINFIEHAWATGVGLAILVLVAFGMKMMERSPDRLPRMAIALILSVALALFVMMAVPVDSIGAAFLGLLSVYLVFRGARVWSEPDPRGVLRLLLALLAAFLMLRMILNGRVIQYGFVQSALAGVVIAAVAVGELPVLARSSTRVIGLLPMLTLWGILVMHAVLTSGEMFRAKTLAIGEGRDQFFAAPLPIAEGTFVNYVLGYFQVTGADRKNGSVLVLPEGAMINYLLRKPTPLPSVFYFSSALHRGKEAAVVEQLDRRRPSWIVLMSRDLSEYGIRLYAQREGEGKLLVDWARAHYRIYARAVQGNPFSPMRPDVWILEPKGEMIPENRAP